MVGRAMGDLGGADAAKRTAAVLDHHGLAERMLQMYSKQAGNLIRGGHPGTAR